VIDECCILFMIMLSVVILSVVMLSVIMLSVIMLSDYAEGRYAECRYYTSNIDAGSNICRFPSLQSLVKRRNVGRCVDGFQFEQGPML
jgi:hypothetical protein